MSSLLAGQTFLQVADQDHVDDEEEDEDDEDDNDDDEEEDDDDDDDCGGDIFHVRPYNKNVIHEKKMNWSL